MKKFLSFLILFSASGLFACSFFYSDSSRLGDKMRDAYQVSARLFTYVWNHELFMDPSSEKEVIRLLKRMDKDFHSIDESDDIGNDPGFVIALNAQSNLLKDVLEQFEQGNKEYAWWNLKGITHNCVACHSRFSSRTDFIGVDVEPRDTTFESKIAAAEFLIASRQFSKAENKLLDLAREISQVQGGSSYGMQVLRLWLIVQVRVQESFHGAAVELSKLKDMGEFNLAENEIISNWIIDLQKIQSKKPFNDKISLIDVKKILGDISSDRTIDEDDRDLVKTAYASSLLHTLAKEDSDVDRSKLLLYLGIAYQRMTIPSLKSLAPLYFEQCIREFPDSDEAKIAFNFYEKDFYFQHTGSSGYNATVDENQIIKELRELTEE